MYEKETEIAIAAVQEAAQLCEQVRAANNTQTMTKADASPVTIADFGTQALICRRLLSAFPDDLVIGEEEATHLPSESLTQITQAISPFVENVTPEAVRGWINRGQGGIASRYWTIDPIDGTKGYIRGDQYAIALAFIEDGIVKVGVMGCPALPWDLSQPTGKKGVIFVAVKGQGAKMLSLDGNLTQPIQVNSHSSLQIIESVESAHSDQSQQEAIAQALRVTTSAVRMDSQAKYGAVARGDADLYLRIPTPESRERRENIWDHAAGAIVVEEAGGKVTDLHGNPLDFSLGAKLERNYGIVASNGAIHEQVLTEWQKLTHE